MRRLYLSNGDVLDWPNVRLVRPRWHELQEPYAVEWTPEPGRRRLKLVIEAGYQWDGASIPAIAEWYLGRDLILPASLPHDFQYDHRGRHPPGSLFVEFGHTWVDTYTFGGPRVWTRDMADRFFARNLKFCLGLRDHQRRNAYRMVRAFGWWYWR
jgi:hypothetical protein